MNASPASRLILVVAALVRQGDEILLVEQQGEQDQVPTWAIPGGVVRSGENLDEALRREVNEETGLEVTRVGALQYLVEVDEPERGRHSISMVFAAEEWAGQLLPADPDGLILQACFLPISEAMDRVQSLPWRSMREPLLACLNGRATPGAVWAYTSSPEKGEELIISTK